MSLNRQIFKNSVIVTAISAGVQCIGIFIPVLIAQRFGVNRITDSYYLAIALPSLLISIIVGGSIKIVFIPVFIEERIKNPDAVDKIVGGITSLLLLLSFLIMSIIAIIVKMDIIKFSPYPETAILTSQLIFEMLPLIPLTILFYLFNAVYNSYQRFGLAEVAQMLNFMITVFFIVFLSGKLGIHSVVAGKIVGQAVALLMLAWLIWRRLGVNLRLSWFILEGVKRMLKLSMLAFTAFIFASLNPFFSRLIAALLPEGSIAILGFAQKLALIPSLFIGGGFTAVLTSYWSKTLAEENGKTIGDSLNRVVSTLMMVLIPILTGMILLREPLVKIAFLRGAFDEEASNATMAVFALLALQILPSYIHNSVVRILHVNKAVKELVLVSFIGLIINVVLMYFLGVKMSLGVNGVALGMLLGTLSTMCMTIVVVHRKYISLSFKSLSTSFFKIIVATILMGFIVILIKNFIPVNFTLSDLIVIISCGIIGIIVYVFALKLLDHKELNIFWNLISTKIA